MNANSVATVTFSSPSFVQGETFDHGPVRAEFESRSLVSISDWDVNGSVKT